MTETWLARFGDGTSETINAVFDRGWRAYNSGGESDYSRHDSAYGAAMYVAGRIAQRCNTTIASLGRYEDARDATEIERAVHAERDACVECIRALADGKPLRDAAMLRLAATILRRCRESGATVINASISYPTDADGRPTEE